MSESESKPKWLIVYCEKDTSFSLIEENEAVFDKAFLTEGDKVRFYYDGKEYDGLVRAMGDDDEYDNLMVRLRELNASNKKKEDSFHADRPRKNRGGSKLSEAVNSQRPRQRTERQTSKPHQSGAEATTGMKKQTAKTSVTDKLNTNSKTEKVSSVGGKAKVKSDSSSSNELRSSHSASSSRSSSTTGMKKETVKTSETDKLNTNSKTEKASSVGGKAKVKSDSSSSNELRSSHSASLSRSSSTTGMKKQTANTSVTDKLNTNSKTEKVLSVGGKAKVKSCSSSSNELRSSHSASLSRSSSTTGMKKQTANTSVTDKLNTNSKTEKASSVGGKPKVKSDSSSSSESGSSHSASSSCSSSPLPEDVSPNEARIAAQVKRKGRDQDVKTVKKLKVVNQSGNLCTSPPKNVSEPRKTSIFGSQTSSSKIFHIFSDSEDSDEEAANHIQTEMDCVVEVGDDEGIEGNENRSDKGDGSEKEEMQDANDKKKNKAQKKKEAKEDERMKAENEAEKKKQKLDKGKESSLKIPEVDFKVLKWTVDDEDVEEINGKSKDMLKKILYVSPQDLQRAKACKNASTFAKTLLVAAFTKEALFNCSVSGGQYRAGGRANITQKPPLPAGIIALILDVTLHRQTNKNWNPKLSKKEVMSALRQKLVDVRPGLKKIFESEL